MNESKNKRNRLGKVKTRLDLSLSRIGGRLGSSVRLTDSQKANENRMGRHERMSPRAGAARIPGVEGVKDRPEKASHGNYLVL